MMTVVAVLVACGCGREAAVEQGGWSGNGSAVEEEGQGGAGAAGLEGKRVVMVVAHRSFRDEELFKPMAILEKAGAEVAVASSSMERATGALGGTVQPDVLLKDVRSDDYDAVVFVGGTGAKEYWEDERAHAIAREAVDGGKVVGAICIGPVTLANAGVLRGRKATVWESEAERLKRGGAVYTGRSVERDGRVITADGPESAEEFGRALVRALGG